MPSIQTPTRPPSVILLVAVTGIGSLALNIFVPSMPGLVRVFGTDYATVQLTLTLYLVGLAVGQLAYGPLSDRFGRRPVLLGGLILFTLGSILCAVAGSIGALILGRVAQALGGCAGMVLSRAIVRDVYGRERSASVLAYVTMAMAVAPMIAPALGGYLDTWFGWRASFFVLIAVGAVIIAWSLLALHETNSERQPLPGLSGMLTSFAGLLRDPAFVGFALNLSFATATFFAFLAGAPYIMSELLGQAPSGYGVWFGVISVGYIIGNFLAGRLSVRVGSERMVMAGTVFGILGVAGTAAWTGLFGLSTLGLFLPMALVALGNGICMPNAIALAISVNPRAAGAASGLLGSLQMSISAACTSLVGLLKGPSAMPTIAVMGVLVALAFASYLAALRPRQGVRTSA